MTKTERVLRHLFPRRVRARRYHRIVQQGILQFGRKHQFRKVVGDNIPIHINHPTRREQILYRPDAHFVTKHGKLLIFEVLDDELHDDNLVIADVIQAYLVPNVSRIFFIVPTPHDQDKIETLSVTIYARLVDMGISKRDLRDIRTFYLSREEARSVRSVAEFIERNLPMGG